MKYLCLFIMTASMLTACNSGANKAAAEKMARQQTIDSLNAVLAKQKVIDSMKEAQQKTVKNNTHAVQSGGDMTIVDSHPAKKKGWSHTAKGAVVGAGTGAVTGAIINSKNRGEGALIGTLIGAGVGAGTGLIVDNSVKKKKKKASQH